MLQKQHSAPGTNGFQASLKVQILELLATCTVIFTLVSLPGLRVAEEICKAHFQRQLDQKDSYTMDGLFS